MSDQRRVTERPLGYLLDAQVALAEFRIEFQRRAASGVVTHLDLAELDRRLSRVEELLGRASSEMDEADMAVAWGLAHFRGGIGPWHMRLAREHGRHVVIAKPIPDDPDVQPLIGLLREAA